jgi:hypothetical protein
VVGNKGETMPTGGEEAMEDIGVIEEGAAVLAGEAEAEAEERNGSRLGHGNPIPNGKMHGK